MKITWDMMKDLNIHTKIQGTHSINESNTFTETKEKGKINFVSSSKFAREPIDGKGFGYVAKEKIERGSLLLVEKAYIGILDVEATRKYPMWDDIEGSDTDALTCEFMNSSKEILELVEKTLHPLKLDEKTYSDYLKREEDMKKVRGEEEEEEEEEEKEGAELEKYHDMQLCLEKLYPMDSNEKCVREKRYLLQEKVRYNSLGYYTNSEQYCYGSHFKKFTGTGLYLLSSNFNHSCEPNVFRYCIGDVILFYAINDILPEEELCISYIGNDILPEDFKIRANELNRDFTCSCIKCSSESKTSKVETTTAKNYVHVSDELQAELSLMTLVPRIKYIDGLLDGTN